MSNLIKDTSINITHVHYAYSDFHLEEKYIELKNILEQKSHAFIVFLGALIGGVFSLFVAYHVDIYFLNYIFFTILPIGFAYLLRKIYINTIIKIE